VDLNLGYYWNDGTKGTPYCGNGQFNYVTAQEVARKADLFEKRFVQKFQAKSNKYATRFFMGKQVP